MPVQKVYLAENGRESVFGHALPKVGFLPCGHRISLQGSYFTKKESNYGHIFLTSLAYNFIQFLRLNFDGMSFKDALETSSAYLLWKNPPACVFEVAEVLDRAFGDNGCERSDKMNSLCEGRMVGLGGVMG